MTVFGVSGKLKLKPGTSPPAIASLAGALAVKLTSGVTTSGSVYVPLDGRVPVTEPPDEWDECPSPLECELWELCDECDS